MIQQEQRDVLAEISSSVAADYDWSSLTLVAEADVPPDFRRLLVHTEHMTTTLAAYHGAPVSLTVLDRHVDESTYARRIQLYVEEPRRVVEFGIMRFDLSLASPPVCAAVQAAQTPLGDILIEFNVMRVIEPRWFIRIDAGNALLPEMGLPGDREAFGRIGRIHCDGKPAIDLLEVVTDQCQSSDNKRD
ncbi:MAG: hypothetical protein ACPGXK_17130 [Phycisphaerae bacterium]